jgi:oligopeptide/dipeptide ABC transporter ATP-binding protein
MNVAKEAIGTVPVIEVRNVRHWFALRGAHRLHRMHEVLRDVSFEIYRGEILALIGESGSGKTTLARVLFQNPRPATGSICFQGNELTRLHRTDLHAKRRGMQLIFQDSFGSLDPRWTVEKVVGEPLIPEQGRRAARREKVAAALDLVGLDPATYGRRLRADLSGGQCQRVAIARALVVKPTLLVCDEAVSALDVLIQSSLLDLFLRLRRELALSYLFIAHDLALVRNFSDRVAVLYLGRLCEIGPTEAIYADSRHPYTVMLLAATSWTDRQFPDNDAVLHSLAPEELPVMTAGCRFSQRCPRVHARCRLEEPELRRLDGDHWVACHAPDAPSGNLPP